MKRFAALLLCAVLLVSAVSAQAASLITGVQAQLKMRLATRTGPSTNYTELGTYFSEGDWVTAVSRAWDKRNSIWWVQVEYTYRNEKYRAYTGLKRLDMSLTAVPEDVSRGFFTVGRNAYAWNGPGEDYNMPNLTVPAGTYGEVWGEEYGYVQFEYYDESRKLYRRVWLQSGDLNGYDSWYDDGWYDDGWYDDGYEFDWTADPTLSQWTAPAINPNVYTPGDSHLIIYWVQQQLKTLGYYTASNALGNDVYDATGILDEATRSAIVAFQKNSGLSQTGYVTQTLVDTIRSRQRWQGIEQYPVYIGGGFDAIDGLFLSPLAMQENRSHEIRILQTMLKALDYNVGSVDGVFGNKTMAAFNTWQLDYGYNRTGTVQLGHVYDLLTLYMDAGYDPANLPRR